MSTFPEPVILADAERGAAVARDDRAHVFHSWSAQALIAPLPIAGASGSHFWDYDGKKYLDFSSQLVNVNIGTSTPSSSPRSRRPPDAQCTIAPFHANDALRGRRLIVERAPGDLDKVFFTNGGAEATENAMRMAACTPVATRCSRPTAATTAPPRDRSPLTGDPRRWPSEPGMPGVVHFWGPYPYRSRSTPPTRRRSASGPCSTSTTCIMVEGPTTIAAIILETVVGTNGILVPPPGYLAGVRELCDRARDRADRRRGHVRASGAAASGSPFDHWDVSPTSSASPRA
jgi:taurine--2-oxoglutarate transaminase